MTRLTQISILAIALVTGCQEQGETVGPRGGTVVSDDGRFSLEIRPGALEEDVDITIDEVDCESMSVAAAVGPCYEVGPRGTAFLFPAKVTYELEDADLDGADELAFSVQKNDAWKLLADRVVDVDDGTLTASAVYLSSFAIVSVH